MIEHAMFEKFAIESVELRWRSKRCLDLFMRWKTQCLSERCSLSASSL